MFRLKTWVDKDGELTPKGRKLSRVLVYTYLLCLVLLCWTPQYGLVEGVETPGIQHFGRVVVLLTPFNSLTNFYQLDSLKEIVFVLGQNVTNIFLLNCCIGFSTHKKESSAIMHVMPIQNTNNQISPITMLLLLNRYTTICCTKKPYKYNPYEISACEKHFAKVGFSTNAKENIVYENVTYFNIQKVSDPGFRQDNRKTAKILT